MSTWQYGPNDRAETPEVASAAGVKAYTDGVPVSVVLLGAMCRLGAASRNGTSNFRSVSIQIEEYALLSDGSQLTIRSDRGVSVGWTDERRLSEVEARKAVAGALLPDEHSVHDKDEPHPWTELASLLSAAGVNTTPETLKSLPYKVEFSSELRETFSD